MKPCNGTVYLGHLRDDGECATLPCDVAGPLCDGCKEDRADARFKLLAWALLPPNDQGQKHLHTALEGIRKEQEEREPK